MTPPASTPDPRFQELADLPFPGNQPTAESAARLRDELLFQRAIQVYLWALPAVNLMAMKEASEKTFGAGYQVLPVWKERLDAKTIVTTPNSDVIYAMGYLDLGADGPLVIEIPPQQQGILDDFWQRPIPGPEAPAGQERNWIRTMPDKGWFTLVRFYSPTQPFFDQTWKLDDIEKIG